MSSQYIFDTLRVPTRADIRVQFAHTTRSASTSHKVLRSPPPKSRSSIHRRPTLPKMPSMSLAHSSDPRKSTEEKVPKRKEVKIVDGTLRRMPFDWVPIAEFKPYDYTLLPLDVAQRRQDISHRAFRPSPELV